MNLYVYAFVAGKRTAPLRGLGGAPVRVLGAEAGNGTSTSWGALVSDADELGDLQTSHALVHDRILGHAADHFHSVVPVRFGCVLGADELRALLRRHRSAIEVELGRLAGALEFAVRLVAPRGGPARRASPTRPGEAYLARKFGLAELGQLRAGAAPVRERLSRLAREVDESRRSRPGFVEVVLTFLVPRSNVERFGSALEEIGAQPRAGTSLLWSGPWAPQSFVRLDLGAEALGPAARPARGRASRMEGLP